MPEFNPTATPFPHRSPPPDPLSLCPRAAQAIADLQVQKLYLLFGILMSVDGFSDAALLREVGHNASQLLSDAAMLYRQAIAQTREGRP